MANISNLWKTGDFSDVIFVVEKKEIHAHKLILASISPIFKESFYGKLPAPSKIVIDDPNFNFSTMMTFLGYFYTNKVEINEDNVFELLNLSNLYQIQKIVEECRDYLASKFTSSSIVETANSIAFLMDSQLLNKVVEFIIHQSSVFHSQSDFNKLSSDVVKAILEQEYGWMSCPKGLPQCKSFFDYTYEEQLGVLCFEVHDGLSEALIIKRVHGWGINKCLELEKEQTVENVCEILKEMIPLLRFPTVEKKTFSLEIYSLGLVDDKKAVQIMRTMVEKSDDGSSPNYSRFSARKRGFKHNYC
uniref:BTB domain-containing protein n=1 Tax=Panagrolaimus sp. JU765 TaxID=591449 RepID=A0AC34QJM9_9BILA